MPSYKLILIMIILPLLIVNNSSLTVYFWLLPRLHATILPPETLPPLSFLSAAVSELVSQCLPERRRQARRGLRGVIRLGGGNSEIWRRARQAF